MGRVAVVDELRALGGVATWRALRRQVSRHAIERAVAAGDVVVDGRGRYALPNADRALRLASRLGGVLSHRSAALAWGWAVARPPERPDVTVPKHRRVGDTRPVSLHWADLDDDDLDGRVTSRTRTLADCLRTLDADEALAVADSALRSGWATRESVERLTGDLRGPGSARARLVAERASHLAANPFESVLRSLALDACLDPRPQVDLFAGEEFLGRPDLVDVDRRLVMEADSFLWHGGRSALRRDAQRYNRFVRHGWTVLRFRWEEVLHHQGSAREVLGALAQRRPCPTCLAC